MILAVVSPPLLFNSPDRYSRRMLTRGFYRKGAKGGASGTGKEKFREMLLDLRKDEKAPGATGY